jgi:hypothetical protein
VTIPLAIVLVLLVAGFDRARAQSVVPETPVIQEVGIVSDWEPGDEGVIWSDDFEAPEDLGARYQDVGANGGRFGVADGVGIGGGRGIRQHYDSGQVGAGWAWRFFGDHPSVRNGGLREVWARFYHRFDTGFVGVPPKMARMGSFGWDDWTLACMAHYWWATRGASRGRAIADVASNIAPGSDQPIERGYNKLSRWMPVAISSFRADTVPNTGRWICYEMRVKLNDPSVANGEYEYWADGVRILSVSGRDLIGGFGARGINGLQLDTYWNEGSPRPQDRFYDHVVVATHPIGLARSSRTPSVRKTPFSSADGSTQRAWELEIALSSSSDSVVWRSGEIAGAGDRVDVGPTTGSFVGPLAGARALDGDRTYVARVRAQGASMTWSDWSPWHGMFLTLAEPVSAVEREAVEREAVERTLSVVPNPAAERVVIDGIDGEYAIVDRLGRAVAAGHGDRRVVVTVAEWPSGLYMVRSGGRSRLVTVVR